MESAWRLLICRYCAIMGVASDMLVGVYARVSTEQQGASTQARRPGCPRRRLTLLPPSPIVTFHRRHMKYGAIHGVQLPVARLVLGTASLARGASGPDGILDKVFESGGNAFDTARVYGLGSSERELGRWIRARGIRSKVVIITKGAHPDLLTFKSRLDGAAIAADLQRSLRSLRTDYIDLYLLHRDDGSAPVSDIVETLDGLQRRGLIRAYGVSNWEHLRVAEALRHAEEHGLAPIAASSPHFSLAQWRQPPWPGCVSISGADGAAARGWYHARGLPVLAWSSLSGGYFAQGGAVPHASRADRTYDTESNAGRRERAGSLAARKGVTTPQVALAYVLAQGIDVFPIVSTRSVARYAEDAASLDLALTPAEVAWLETGSGM
jgi:aryl-alcohol dehydrogenase-like predicted oxidoreductase